MSFTDGAEILVISVCATILENAWSLSTFEVGFLGTSLYIGYAAGPLSDQYWGRKYVMLVSAFAILVIGLVCACVDDYLTFITLRSLIGVFIGMVVTTEKTYYAETLPQ